MKKRKIRDTVLIIITLAAILIAFFCQGLIVGITKWKYPGIYILSLISWLWVSFFIPINVKAFRNFITRHNSK